MKIFRSFCIVLLKGYQYIGAPLAISFGVRCRFEPSCSHYAIEAINTHGVLKGFLLTAHRLGRCQPFCNGGHDPVPKQFRFLRE